MYTTCQCTLLVKVHYLLRYTTCQCALLVNVHYLSRYTTCQGTLLTCARDLKNSINQHNDVCCVEIIQKLNCFELAYKI